MKIQAPDHQVNIKMISTESLISGIYVVQVVQEDRVLETFKLIVE